MSTTMTRDALHWKNMQEQRADPEETWEYLRNGMNQIMTNPDSPPEARYIITLYTAVYNFCTWHLEYKKASAKGDVSCSSGGSGVVRGDKSVGSYLYERLLGFFVEHLQPMIEISNSLSGVDLLIYYAKEWDRYTTGANYLNRSFTYLNRHWIEWCRHCGLKTIYPVYTLALVQWKTHFLLHQQNQAVFTNTLLTLIAQERHGELIDQSLVKKIVNSFVSLGLDNRNLSKECLDVYEDHFETPFIAATEQYYKTKSDAFLASNSIPDYLKAAEAWLKGEEDRAERYLHAKTREVLIRKCEHVLIREHLELLWSSCQTLMDVDQDESLQTAFPLLSRIPEGREKCLELRARHGVAEGADASSEFFRLAKIFAH